MKLLKLVLLFLAPMLLDAQIDIQYQSPHKDIMDLADAPLAPLIRLNNDRSLGLLLYRSAYKSIEELSETELRLAGLRINPRTNIGSRTRYYNNMKLLDVDKQQEYDVKGLPINPKIANIVWSYDQLKIAFTLTESNGVSLWVLDTKTRNVKRLTDIGLNGNMGNPFTWMKDNEHLIVKMLPTNRPELIDKKTTIPSGPTVSVNDGKKAQNRTYQDLLKNPNDEHDFEVLANSELWKISVQGEKEMWMAANIYSGVSISPDGSKFLVSTIHRPYSYLVPYRRFPTDYKIYDSAANLIKDFLKVPLIEDLPQGFMAVRSGPRSMDWRSNAPATLYWAEALDGGDPDTEVDFRDAVYQLDAPFNGDKKLITKTKYRYSGITWSEKEIALSSSYWWNTRMSRVDMIYPDNPEKQQTLMSERNYQDRYADPGFPVMEENAFGRNTMVVDGNFIYLIGEGWSDEGKKPFVDKYNYVTTETQRIYQSTEKEKLEDILSAIDLKKGEILVRMESPNEYPNYYKKNIYNNEIRPVTSFDNPFKSIQDVHKEVISYTREDGLELSATLYLPVGYDIDKKPKMPMLLWAYPREFKDKNSASQVTSSSKEFTYPYYGSPIYWVNRGYVVLDDAAFPIVGEGDDEPNDSFREQLVANAKAAIDAVDNLGYIDRNRVGVGGHSYGAFMVANLLSHSDLFAAGIARSGAYNRTLTPFGFQSEERNYWEAPDVYYTMSPFMHADKMKTPLLLIHGEADNNSGTYPMQSERYFNALKGLGATVRLIMLPKESHGYAARESIMHMLWEQDQWLEKYVKNNDKTKSTLRP
jgi:dipeptidyl aminopeptidase/acylaminoacyl peptidase